MSAVSVLPTFPVLQSEGGLSHYLAAIRKFPLLTASEEAMYARRWREHGDTQAAYHLVTSHLRLAAKIALRYRGYGLPVADLISEGNIGLMLAVKRFKLEKGCRLATYAMWWIKAKIQDYILRSWSLVRIGTTNAQKKLFFNLRRLKNKIGAGDESDLSPEQIDYISEELDVGARDVIEMNRRMRGDISLNLPTANRHDGAMQDRLADPTADPEILTSEAEDRKRIDTALKKALAGLRSRERHIIEARYFAEPPKTLEELGRTFQVSRERIRQIESRALQKLKHGVVVRLEGVNARPRQPAPFRPSATYVGLNSNATRAGRAAL